MDEILSKTDGRCAYCGVDLQGKYHKEHVLPKSRGGVNSKRNLVASCERCNMRKHAMTPDEFRDFLHESIDKKITSFAADVYDFISFVDPSAANKILKSIAELQFDISYADIAFYANDILETIIYDKVNNGE